MQSQYFVLLWQQYCIIFPFFGSRYLERDKITAGDQYRYRKVVSPHKVFRAPSGPPSNCSLNDVLQICVQMGSQGRGLCGQEEAPCPSGRGNHNGGQ